MNRLKAVYKVLFKKEQLREELADLEHQQWMSWTEWLIENRGDELPDDLVEKWEKNHMEYRFLPEDEKDKDRKWGDKVLAILYS